MSKKPLSDSTYSSLSATDTICLDDVQSAVKMLEEASMCKKHKIKYRLMFIPIHVCPKCNHAIAGNAMIDKELLFPEYKFDPIKATIQHET